jgi:hypothetical protein
VHKAIKDDKKCAVKFENATQTFIEQILQHVYPHKLVKKHCWGGFSNSTSYFDGEIELAFYLPNEQMGCVRIP